MKDARFEAQADDLAELLMALDLDDLEDLATLLTVTLARPVLLVDGETDDGRLALEVVVGAAEGACGIVHEFPTSTLSLIRASSGLAIQAGSYTREGLTCGSQATLELSDDDLVTALQGNLGQVRIFRILLAAE